MMEQAMIRELSREWSNDGQKGKKLENLPKVPEQLLTSLNNVEQR